jgi:hypothetical protein
VLLNSSAKDLDLERLQRKRIKCALTFYFCILALILKFKMTIFVIYNSKPDETLFVLIQWLNLLCEDGSVRTYLLCVFCG